MNGEKGPLQIIAAETFLARAFGLLFRKPLSAGEALHLNPCNAIHTVGMRYAIDLVFLNGSHAVVSVRGNVGRFRFRRCKAAKSVLELAAGEARRLGLRPGMRIDFSVGKIVERE